MRRIAWAAAAVVGLVVVIYVTRALAFQARGFDLDKAEQGSDCDQCTLIETLEVLPWILLACLGCIAAVSAIALLARHKAASARSADHTGR